MVAYSPDPVRLTLVPVALAATVAASPAPVSVVVLLVPTQAVTLLPFTVRDELSYS